MKFGLWGGLAIAVSVGATPALSADARYYPPAPSRVQNLYAPAPLITGNIELYFGTEDPSAGGAGSIVGGAGRVNMPMTADWSLQIDAYGSSSSSALSASQSGITAHFYRRDPNAYAIGFFVGYTNTNGGGGSASGPLVGIEGQIYNGPLTLGADVSLANLSNGVDTVVTIHGQARFYLMPNLKLQADASHASVSGGNDVTSVGLGAEYRFTNTPFSIFAAGRYDHAPGQNVSTGVIGGRLFFDPPGATLQSHERSGAGWLISPGLRF